MAENCGIVGGRSGCHLNLGGGCALRRSAGSVCPHKTLIGKILDWTIGARNWVAVPWRANDFAIVANGGAPSLDTNGALPIGAVWLMVGATPDAATAGTSCCEAISRVGLLPAVPSRQRDADLHGTVGAQSCGPRPTPLR